MVYEDSDALSGRIKLVCIAGIVSVLALAAYFGRHAHYTADSWGYYELSRTVFSGEFYKFNFHRTFFPGNYSASFPFGLPVVMAVVDFLLGTGALTGVVLNIAITVVVWLVILRIARQLELKAVFGVVLATSAVFWPHYLDELVGGCSIPLALMLFLFGVTSYLSKNDFSAGLFLGLGAVTRFDHLVHGIVFQIASFTLDHGSFRRALVIGAGFLTGISPWLLYSLIHFDKVWVSDNSWVALSAVPAFVEDFPAAATMTAIQQPLMWLFRVIGNTGPLLAGMALAAARHPVFCVTLVVFFIALTEIVPADRRRVLAFTALCTLSLGPLCLTGYFDRRYFGLFFIAVSTAILWAIQRSAQVAVQKRTRVLLVSALAVMLGYAGWKLALHSRDGIQARHREAQIADTIKFLQTCHETDARVTYIFYHEMRSYGARYGSFTGQRGSILPSNYDRLTPEKKRQFFAMLAPYALLPSITNDCPAVTRTMP